MFGWRRRNDGFEWREYVRTTILVRRKNRRERVARAGVAAVEGLKVAGQRGAVAGAKGAQALGRGAMAAGQHGAVVGAAGAQAAGRRAFAAGRQGVVWGARGARAAAGRLRAGLPVLWKGLQAFGARLLVLLSILWSALRVCAAWLWRALAPLLARGLEGLAPAARILRQPNIAMPLAFAGGVALLGACVRAAVVGPDRDTLIASVVGLTILGALLAARYAGGGQVWLAAPLHFVGRGLGGLARLRPRLASVPAPFARTAVIAALVIAVAVAGWLAWQASPALPTMITAAVPEAAKIEGRARALSGDTLRIAGTTVAIAGIEAPLYGQTCTTPRSRRWRCGRAAKVALSRLVAGHRVSCELAGASQAGRQAGTCRHGDADIAAKLVRAGHVFAVPGLFSAYGSLEAEARAAKRGIWRGNAERPADYRAQKWDDAKRAAPEGCPIKGNVKGGRRLYVLPWVRGYERVKISSRRGERWFCSEEEALAAGWKPSDRS